MDKKQNKNKIEKIKSQTWIIIQNPILHIQENRNQKYK
jgi:hypothetical protein